MVRPAEIFYSRMTPALEGAGLSSASSRRQWPHELLRRVYSELVAETPRELLAQELWLQSADTYAWWAKTQAFARSCSTMSMLGYANGLADCRPDDP